MPSGSHEYYKTLGVPRTASADQIRRAHRKLARRYHPDLNPGDKLAEERFKNIQEAYDVLIDSNARRRYDETALKSKPAPAPTPAATTASARPHPATNVGFSVRRERMDERAADHLGLRDFYVPRPEKDLAAVFVALLIVITFTFLWVTNPFHSDSLAQRLTSFGWEGYRLLEPFAILSAVGFLLGGTRGTFMAKCALVNAATWFCFFLYCWKAHMPEWPAVVYMLPWVLATHVPVMLGAFFSRGIAGLTS
jgi:hypothetical protein